MTPEERAHIALAQHIGYEGNVIDGLTAQMETWVAEQIRAAIAEEREACATLAQAAADRARERLGLVEGNELSADVAAAAIRARW